MLLAFINSKQRRGTASAFANGNEALFLNKREKHHLWLHVAPPFLPESWAPLGKERSPRTSSWKVSEEPGTGRYSVLPSSCRLWAGPSRGVCFPGFCCAKASAVGLPFNHLSVVLSQPGSQISQVSPQPLPSCVMGSVLSGFLLSSVWPLTSSLLRACCLQLSGEPHLCLGPNPPTLSLRGLSPLSS